MTLHKRNLYTPLCVVVPGVQYGIALLSNVKFVKRNTFIVITKIRTHAALSIHKSNKILTTLSVLLLFLGSRKIHQGRERQNMKTLRRRNLQNKIKKSLNEFALKASIGYLNEIRN